MDYGNQILGKQRAEVSNFRSQRCYIINSLIGTCGVSSLDSDVISWRYNSTLEGSVIQFWCNESPDQVFTAECNEDGIWSLNLNNFAHCRPSMFIIMNLILN